MKILKSEKSFSKNKLFLVFLCLIIFSFFSFSNTDASWYNNNWRNCKNISMNFSATKTNYPTMANTFRAINLTGLTFSSTDEIRITNSFCNNSGTEIARDILQNGTDWAEAIFLVNTSAGANVNYSVYYNYSGATAPSYTTDLNCSGNRLANSVFTTGNNFAYASTNYGGSTNFLNVTAGDNVDEVLTAYLGKYGWTATGTCTSILNGSVVSIVNCTSSDLAGYATFYVYAYNGYIDQFINTNLTSWSVRQRHDVYLNGSVAKTSAIWANNESYSGADWTARIADYGYLFIYNSSALDVFGTMWNESFFNATQYATWNLAGYSKTSWIIGEGPVNTKRLTAGQLYVREVIGTIGNIPNVTVFNSTDVNLYKRTPLVYSIGASEAVPVSVQVPFKNGA